MLTLGIPSGSLGNDLNPVARQPQDAVAFLDLRAFEDEETVWTELGLVQPGKADELRFDFDVRQLLLVTSVNPWIYIAAGAKKGVITR